MHLLIWNVVLSLVLLNSVVKAEALSPVLKPVASLAVDVTNPVRLQKGAMLYMNYCSGCHSLQYLRYNRMAQDLGLTTFTGSVDEALLKNNLIFTEARIDDPIRIAMPAEDALQWFGMLPPDLSLSARARGTVWLYNYLRGFYRDDTRPFGSNNRLLADVAMPNILAPLAGEVIQSAGAHSQLSIVQSGAISPIEFDELVLDLVTFLSYAAEPAQLARAKLGPYVLLWLSVLLVLVYLLKRSYWQQLKSADS